MSRGIVAVTGGTGFLGRHLVSTLSDQGWTVRALVRRPLAGPDGPQQVVGDLADRPALDALCLGATAVVHGAGLIKAASRAQFDLTNIEGSRQVALAAQAAGARMIAVSSLAARQPALSDYAASKRGGEDAARAVIGEALSIVRPPAIYGPGDLETLGLFKAAARLPVLPVLDPRARLALIHVEDAAARIAGLVSDPRPGIFGLSDARTDGYSWIEVMQAASMAVGRKPRLLRVPNGAIGALARVSEAWSLANGKISIFTSGKAREMLHLDWSLSHSEILPDTIAMRYGVQSGFVHSVQWYRANGHLVEQS